MKTILIALLAFAILSAPQLSQAQLRVGPTVGFNLTSFQHSRDFKERLGETSILPRLRMQIGAIAEYALLDQLYLQSGLIFNGAGVKYQEEGNVRGNTVTVSTKVLINYLDIPLTARYQIAELDNFSLSAWGGFVMGIAVSGRFKNEQSGNGESGSNSEPFGIGSGDDAYLKRGDFRLALGMVAESAEYPIQFKVALNQGLVNTISGPRPGFAQRNFLFSLTASYLFELD